MSGACSVEQSEEKKSESKIGIDEQKPILKAPETLPK